MYTCIAIHLYCIKVILGIKFFSFKKPLQLKKKHPSIEKETYAIVEVYRK